ncbi:hypothetical protein NDR87_14085 [Nocardia sp. CDC159]|uniref:Uncharacterized protein n=1 Tax=Nocardia pulmonis TaxID=2951408 RepID=A0A9X2E527_9NOCA|nr:MULTISPECIES: hypothetical protein [Nocardia]MCM6774447.1 hypothetical protein [Nocardia pulmonis]MCM6787487.1 hypothetical protein [Nocardia sp. CDC159]
MSLHHRPTAPPTATAEVPVEFGPAAQAVLTALDRLIDDLLAMTSSSRSYPEQRDSDAGGDHRPIIESP